MRVIKFIALAISIVSCSSCSESKEDETRFGIYSASLDGKEFSLLVPSKEHEVTHPRVSPDGKEITYTRYCGMPFAGLNTEEGSGYARTEIVVAQIDGSGVKTIAEAHDGEVNANSSWSPDGKEIIYCHKSSSDPMPRIASFNTQSKSTSYLPTPSNLNVSDPHRVKGKVVFAGRQSNTQSIWKMNFDGTGAIKISNPEKSAKFRASFNVSDFDPWLSPDASKVVFMRRLDTDVWHVCLIDLSSQTEVDLSAQSAAADAVPQWSPDGSRIIFWHGDRNDIPATGIYLMDANGERRQMIALPRRYKYMHPGFYFSEKKQLRIILNATKL